MTFAKDLVSGTKGEKLVCDFLTSCGYIVLFNKCKEKRSHYDIYIEKPLTTFEVKFDFKSSLTGNIAIERYNPVSKKVSGIDISEADYWVYIVYENKIPILHFCKRVNLLSFIDYIDPYKKVTGGDNMNSDMWLYKKEVLLGEYKSCKPFQKLSIEQAKNLFGE